MACMDNHASTRSKAVRVLNKSWSTVRQIHMHVLYTIMSILYTIMSIPYHGSRRNPWLCLALALFCHPLIWLARIGLVEVPVFGVGSNHATMFGRQTNSHTSFLVFYTIMMLQASWGTGSCATPCLCLKSSGSRKPWPRVPPTHPQPRPP